ncbi:MAG: HAMP domain-containing sensor histidine kinase [Verrucomicrobiota bacterium]
MVLGQQQPLQLATPPALSSIGAVRALQLSEAQKGLSVRIRGVVTYYEPRWDTLFVQDETGGLYIFPSGQGRPRYHHGQVLELSGRTFGNSHGNSLIEEVATEAGAGPLPEARAITYAELQRGGYDSQWVELRGVVRAISAEFQRVVVDIDAGGRFQAHLPRPSAEPLPLSILHARVRVRGVAGTVLNQNEEIVGARLFVPAFDSFTVLQEGVPEPFSLPIQPLAEFQAPDAAQSAKRTHVRGVVSLRWPTGKVFIQDEGSGLEIEVIQARKFNDPEGSFHPGASPVAFEVGDRIDAVGYPAGRRSRPVLEEADVRVIAPAVGIRPDPLQPSLALDTRNGARLVEVRASFIEQIPPDDESGLSVRRYLCEADNRRFEARLTGAQPLTTTLLPGSRLKVTGVIEVRPNPTSPMGGFLLWMRSPADLENLGAPPIWKTREMVRILVVVGLAALVGVGWIALLRRQVSQQTAQLRDANEKLHQALAEERELRQLKSNFVSLVSHEFRTPLGIIMSSGEILQHYHEQLDPESRREQLQSIHRSVRRMADMMSEVLLLGKVEADGLEFKPAPFELQSFCERIRDEIITATNHSCPILFNSREPATTVSGDEVVLGHIFTNLLSNAVKYSPPGSPVHFTVRRSNGFAVFQIEDSGCGIPLEDQQRLFQAFHRGHNVKQIPGTGLGMVIVKRCVDLHGGTIEVDSKVGVGSRFIVKLPLFDASGSG